MVYDSATVEFPCQQEGMPAVYKTALNIAARLAIVAVRTDGSMDASVLASLSARINGLAAQEPPGGFMHVAGVLLHPETQSPKVARCALNQSLGNCIGSACNWRAS